MGEKTGETTELLERVSTKEYDGQLDVKSLIYVVRGQQVMLDSDLAEIYGYEVKVMNQQVKRNINRFPEDFMFQLTKEEVAFVKSHFVTSRKSSFFSGQEGGRRKPPYAFTEQGIYMLATVLRGEIAEHEESSQRLFFEGQIYDAFRLLTDLVQQAKSSIVLIDNYVDVKTLNILAKKQNGVTVEIYTMKRKGLTEEDIDVFNKQYPMLEVRYVEGFHDRFLIMDNTCAYHIGASLKDAGKKCFGITKIEEQKYIEDILGHLK